MGRGKFGIAEDLNDGTHLSCLGHWHRKKGTNGVVIEDILYDKAAPDDSLGLDHINKNRAGGIKGDSIFIR